MTPIAFEQKNHLDDNGLISGAPEKSRFVCNHPAEWEIQAGKKAPFFGAGEILAFTKGLHLTFRWLTP